MNKVLRDKNNSYIVLCEKHDRLRKLKDLLKFAWFSTSEKCGVCKK